MKHLDLVHYIEPVEPPDRPTLLERCFATPTSTEARVRVVNADALDVQRLALQATATITLTLFFVLLGHLWSPHPAPAPEEPAWPALSWHDEKPIPRPPKPEDDALIRLVSHLQAQNEALLDQVRQGRATAARLRGERDSARMAARAAERRALALRVERSARGRVPAESVVSAVYEQIERQDVPRSYVPRLLELVPAIIQVESAWRPTVVSDAGAVGLMQVLPTWHTLPGLERADCPGGLDRVDTNICAGVEVWMYYLRHCGGAEACALAYYNGAAQYSVSAEQYIAKIQEARS